MLILVLVHGNELHRIFDANHLTK